VNYILDNFEDMDREKIGDCLLSLKYRIELMK
jgi:hypothetical protein